MLVFTVIGDEKSNDVVNSKEVYQPSNSYPVTSGGVISVTVEFLSTVLVSITVSPL
jgi:Na+(H+)/acetate symporter ActP